MIMIPLFETAVATGATIYGSIHPTDLVTHVTQASQEIKEGSLFVALKGKRSDGHNFVQEAEALGAVAAVVEHIIPNVAIPQLIVPCTEEALGHLAKVWRTRLGLPVVGVTGSVGKTSTKELIAHILQSHFKTHKGRKNYNNQLGVPIELMRLDTRDQCSVMEFGMRGKNQIKYLSNIARPSIGVITNIGMSHIELLGNRNNIAAAKAEIFEGMDSTGISIINHDDEYFEFLKYSAKGKIISFGENPNANVRIENIKLNTKGNPFFTLNGHAVRMFCCTGKHHAYNAAIGYAVAHELGIGIDQIIESLETYSTPQRRGNAYLSAKGAFLLDSTYNAAPDSIKSSLYTLNELSNHGKRTIAVIGDMLELGNYSKEAHQHIGDVIKKTKNISMLITVGNYSELIGQKAQVKNWIHFKKASEASKYLLKETKADDIILLQGSNSMRLDTIVNALRFKSLRGPSDVKFAS